MSQSSVPDDWKAISDVKKKALSDSIPPEWRIPSNILPPDTQLDVTSFPVKSGWFSEQELEITAATASSILENVHTWKWSAQDVTKAFCKRAAATHQLTNCLSETLFSSALSRARELDDHLAKTGSVVGPLHGLPISLKDNFNIIGTDSTVGFAHWVNKPATHNSALVDQLQDAGAVFYVKTNVPTAMMIAETVNNVFGRTTNPLNRNLTSGGSSGGESALIAFGGSVLGVGTDIVGSLRIPASLTGIFALRPSFGRFPTRGAASALAGQEAVHSVNGPMARGIGEIELFAKTVVGLRPWERDPKCVPLPWRSVNVGPKLKLGVMWDDGMVRPTPPIQRALKEVVEKLRKAGHEIVDWAPELHEEALGILVSTHRFQHGRARIDRACRFRDPILDLLQYRRPTDPREQLKFFTADGGKSLKAILDPVHEPVRPEMAAYNNTAELGVHALWQLQMQRSTVCHKYLGRCREAGIDGILCATTPFAGVEHGKFKHVAYTGVFNILDYAAISFPCGANVDQALDRASDGSSPLSDVDRQVQADYDASAVHGMPMSLQLVAGRLEEEKVIEMTKVVLKAL
ncbi:hypothetical protein LTR66_006968 [Elasticomyces elasticus]|nr:hypothetical protein LTR66_006968 [Elasticomyces elasticus]